MRPRLRARFDLSKGKIIVGDLFAEYSEVEVDGGIRAGGGAELMMTIIIIVGVGRGRVRYNVA